MELQPGKRAQAHNWSRILWAKVAPPSTLQWATTDPDVRVRRVAACRMPVDQLDWARTDADARVRAAAARAWAPDQLDWAKVDPDEGVRCAALANQRLHQGPRQPHVDPVTGWPREFSVRQMWSLRQYVTYGNRWMLPLSLIGAIAFTIVIAALSAHGVLPLVGVLILLAGWALWAYLIHRGRSADALHAGWDPREVRQCRRLFPGY